MELTSQACSYGQRKHSGRVLHYGKKTELCRVWWNDEAVCAGTVAVSAPQGLKKSTKPVKWPQQRLQYLNLDEKIDDLPAEVGFSMKE